VLVVFPCVFLEKLSIRTFGFVLPLLEVYISEVGLGGRGLSGEEWRVADTELLDLDLSLGKFREVSGVSVIEVVESVLIEGEGFPDLPKRPVRDFRKLGNFILDEKRVCAEGDSV